MKDSLSRGRGKRGKKVTKNKSGKMVRKKKKKGGGNREFGPKGTRAMRLSWAAGKTGGKNQSGGRGLRKESAETQVGGRSHSNRLNMQGKDEEKKKPTQWKRGRPKHEEPSTFQEKGKWGALQKN